MGSYQQSNPGGYSSGPYEGPTTIYMGDPSRTLFSTKAIRSKFVSKVFSILFIQILVATVLIAWLTLHQPTKQYFQTSGSIWLYVAFAVGFITYMVLICVDSTRRNFPMNFILLALLTLAFGLISAIFSAQYNTLTVLSAFAATGLAVLVVTLLAKYSPFDMTTCGCALCVLSLVHVFAAVILTLVLVPTGQAGIASVLIASSGALLVSLYLMFDLQLIMGGRTLELSPEEYILASIMLYLDILNLFNYLLLLFGRD